MEIIPVATAIQNARNTVLGNLGNYDEGSKSNQLCYDSKHLDYEVGCYVAGATLFEFFFRRFCWSVLTEKGYGSYDEAKTFVGSLVDSGGDEGSSNAYTEPTSKTMKIAKYCAIAAVNNMNEFSLKLAEKYLKTP